MSQKLGVIVLDTLRFDVFREQMEDLHRSAVHTYERMYSTARWTPPAHASLFSGLYPTEVGVHVGQTQLATPVPVLPEQLRDAGYHTVALTENINVDSFFGFDRGFEAFHRSPGLRDRPTEDDGEFDWKELETKIPDEGIGRLLGALKQIVHSDASTFRTLKTGFEMYRANDESPNDIDWAIERSKTATRDVDDLFYFANLMTAHYPYDPPASYSPREPLFVHPLELTLRDESVTEEEHARHYENYLGAARYLDDVLPALIDLVDWDLLFVVSDHGELFGEHGLRGHQYGVYDELVHVPALAFGNMVEPGTTSTVTSLVDVYRTLAAVGGVDVECFRRGVNLLADDPPADRVVYAESTGCEWYKPEATSIEARIPAVWNEPHYMVRSDDAMVIVDKDGTQVIDSGSGEAEPAVQCRLVERAESIRAGLKQYDGTPEERELPSDVKQQLGRLGYM